MTNYKTKSIYLQYIEFFQAFINNQINNDNYLLNQKFNDNIFMLVD